jgi:cell wall assembly regulator SMI1
VGTVSELFPDEPPGLEQELDELFDRARGHLRQAGAKCVLRKGRPASGAAVHRAEAQLGLLLPQQLKDVYLRYGNGVLLRWERGADRGRLDFPTVEGLVEQHRGWKELVLWKDGHDFPHVADSGRARATYAGMKSWLPLVEEGNGDYFCVVAGQGGNPVVFHQHDWDDGGTGENGHRVAPDLLSFLRGWAGVCFTAPTGLHWPAAFTEGGVAWTADHFKDKYVIRAAPAGRRSP